MWGRPLKTHPPSGGATLPKKIFVPCMGLICVSVFWMPFCTGRLQEYTHNTSDNVYIYAFCLHWWHPSVCLCFVLYNVRTYVCVRLNVYKHKIMLISVNSFGYMKIVSYLCNVIKTKYY